MLITISGRPITKKNSQQIVRNPRTKKPRVIQSDAYNAYEEECLWKLRRYSGKKFPGPVQIKALFWMPNRKSWPDLMGLLQATCDILQKAEIIVNDRNVISLDGSRIVGVDKDNPRVEIEISEMEE